jgi:RHS repeat-associated protein
MHRLQGQFASFVFFIPFATLFAAITCVTITQAQITNATNDQATPVLGAGHDYIGTLSDIVSPGNGSVSLRINVPTPKGRGMSFPFSFDYNSNGTILLQPLGFQVNVVVGANGNFGEIAGGWRYSLPVLSNTLVNWPSKNPEYPNAECTIATGFVFTDFSSTRSPLNLALANVYLCGLLNAGVPQTSYTAQYDPVYQAWTQNGAVNTSVPFYVADMSGTLYHFPGLGGYGCPGACNVPDYIEDRNGNKITLTQGSGSGFPLTVTDTTGRTLLSASGVGTSGNTVSISGDSAPYTLQWTGPLSYGQISITAGPELTGSKNCNQFSEVLGGPGMNVVSKITLPNGEAYQFFYDATYGLLNKIVYPNGGYVSYSWGVNTQSDMVYWLDGNGNYPGCAARYSPPAVAHRYVSYDGVNVAEQQDFTYQTNWSSSTSNTWTSKVTTVKTTDFLTPGSPVTYTVYNFSPTTMPDPLDVVSKIAAQVPVGGPVYYQDASQNTLRTVTKYWGGDGKLLLSETTTLENGMTSGTYYTYGGFGYPGLGQLIEKDEYDFGSGGAVGALLRKTVNTYQSFSTTPLGTTIYDGRCKTVVSDGASNRLAETDFLYDSGTTVCGTAPTPTLSGTGSYTQHDETLYGTAATVPRGNMTAKIVKCFVGSTNCTDSTTTYTYDETGRITSSTDPCGNASCSDMKGSGHTTTYLYTDSYTSGGTPPANTNAYVTQVTNPLGQTSYFSYDYGNGQVTVAKDVNSQSTTYQYKDFLARPTQINYPDGGQTTYAYNDSTYSASNNTPNVTITKTITSSPLVQMVTTTARDGINHPVLTVLSSDPDGPTYANTVYDGLGRVMLAYNATRCNPPTKNCGESTWGVTTNRYDALGRTSSVLRPDASVVLTFFDETSSNTGGTCTTVFDEAGKMRKSCFDGLGRLVEVDEPGAGASDGSPGTATVTINENSGQVSNTFQVCYPVNGQQQCSNETVYNSGTITLTVDGVPYSTGYGPPPPTGSSTTSSIASALASQISGSVTAVANGSTIVLTATTTGGVTNYSLSLSATYNTSTYCPDANHPPCFSGPSFYASGPSSLTGGTDPSLGTNPPVTLYGYDALNNLLSVQQQGGTTDTTKWRNRSFFYDSLSRLTSATNPESGTIQYSYDANSNVSAKTAPSPNQPFTGTAQVTTSYTYDALNRLTMKSYTDGYQNNIPTPTAFYLYDVQSSWGVTQNNVVGRLSEAWTGTSCCATAGAEIFGYDPMGRILVNEQFTPNVAYKPVNYTYDLAGDVTSATNGEGVTFTYTPYDGAGRTTGLTSSLVDSQHPGTLVTVDPTSGYAPNGALHKFAYGNGLTETSVYNNRLQPCRLNLNSSGTALSTCADAVPSGNRQDLSYGYNFGTADNGNVTAMVGTGNQAFNRTYGYDSLNRLLTMTDSASGQSCKGLQETYDAWGNRTNQATTSGSCFQFSATANTQNQLVGFGYDPAGNMTKDLYHQYYYDAENRIIQVDGTLGKCSTATACYNYDAEGRRVEKAQGSSWSDRIYDLSGSVVAEDSNGWMVGYVYFAGSLLAQYQNSTTYFVHSDHLGSTRLITCFAAGATGCSASQAVYDSLDYQPFGEQIAGDTGTTHKFTGNERDGESGLDSFGARYYGSNMGRFMTPDWAARPTAVPYAVFGDPQSLNLYTYVRNDPVSDADADGHEGEYVPPLPCPESGVPGCWQTQLVQDALSSLISDVLGPQITAQSTAAQNAAQVPTSLHVESATDMTRNDARSNFGIFIDIKYEVRDQNGKAIQSDKMEPMENGTAGIADKNGKEYSGPIVSAKPGENHTQSDGTFHDRPVGDTHPRQPADPIKIQQNITIRMGDKEYKVRSQTFTITSDGYGKGRIKNDLGDIDVSRP